MDQIPSREILWNVHSTANIVLMYIFFGLSLVVALNGVLHHLRFWLSGRDQRIQATLWERVNNLFAWGLNQKGVVRQRFGKTAHNLIYFGFLVLTFTTTMVLIDNDLGIQIYRGNFYLAVTLLSDIFGFGVLIGCGLAFHRRYMTNTDLVHSRQADASMLIFLSVLIVQGFILEALRIHVTQDPWAAYSPIGNLLSKAFWPLSADGASTLHFIFWWFHALTVFVAIALLPYSKFFHIVSSSANLFFKDATRTKGELQYPGNIEELMESGEEFSLGLGSIKDYSWKQLLDLDACTSCGRCQDACPAYNSGKPLSPKWIILDTRNHALAVDANANLGEIKFPESSSSLHRHLINDYFLPNQGLTANNNGYTYDAKFRANNPQVEKAALNIGGGVDLRIASEVIDSEAFWACTTCMACVEACPVGINHVDQIIGNRRNMALIQGEIPTEAQATLRGLESQGNPYGPSADRTKWIGDLEVPILNPGDQVDYLYWVGCVSSFDPRKQKIARAMIKVMRAAGLSFGILGKAEACTGDPARRLGEENLFQTLAKANIATLANVKFKTLVANCPHCFNTLKNEYPQMGGLAGNPEIIHHSVLLKQLLDQNKLLISKEFKDNFTFHDPCYLGRYNDIYEAPRDSIKKIPGLQILEMEKSRNTAMCCGAGGGHFWMDMKIGTRINSIRANQAAETGASKIATACPFCLQMMEDGVKLTNRDLEVRDIAEVIADAL